MERNYRRTISNTAFDPRQLTTIRAFKQSGLCHTRRLPAAGGRCLELSWFGGHLILA
jgi:hypothetical protein